MKSDVKKKRRSIKSEEKLVRNVTKVKLQQQEIQPSTLPLHKLEANRKQLLKCTAPHVGSFDYFVEHGLHHISEDMEPVLVRGPKNKNGTSSLIAIRAHSLTLQKPKVNITGNVRSSALMRPMYPRQCRLARASYTGELYAAFTIVINNKETHEIKPQRIAKLPIMVGSTACNLRDKTREQLVQLGEEEFEFGGAFIANGTERVLRLVVVPRSNHPITAKRDKNASRGPLYTDLSLSYRSMRQDLSTYTLNFHLLKSNGVNTRILIGGNEYFIPVGVLMRALLPTGTTDREIYDLIVGGDSDDSALCSAGIAILKDLSDRYRHFREKFTEPNTKPTVSRLSATAYLGKSFKNAIALDDPGISDLEAGTAFLRRFILVHLSVGPFEDRDDSLDRSKADLLVHIIRKLIATSTKKVDVDNADALSHLSIMTSGHLYQILLKDRIEGALQMVAGMIRREGSKESEAKRAEGAPLLALINESLTKMIKGDLITKHMRYLLATGNLQPTSKLDLPQSVGYSVLGERINILRYMAHFRAVHRGAFYAAMRSTKVRKLLPEAWGFICPVHTPDGDPCGILNHLASEAIVTHGSMADRREIVDLFSDFNVIPAPALSSSNSSFLKGTIPVVVDGRVIGFAYRESAAELADQIRYTKVRDSVEVLSKFSEVVLIEPTDLRGGFMPGIYVYTCGGRFMRPVTWLMAATKKLAKGQDKDGLKEWIGSLEQVFLRVRPAVDNQESSLSPVATRGASHQELSSVGFLSVLSLLSPFPEMNQGPRNMFQCQMAKQTMGTPCHTFWTRNDAKVYRHNTPQVPITRNFCMQDPLGADLFPNGVNAVVAVISYSGNDMEDALILNKASIDRGFAHGTVYLNEHIDLDDSIAGRESIFVRDIQDVPGEDCGAIDADGLPSVGARIEKDTKLYGHCSKHTMGGLKGAKFGRHTSVEDGTVDQVVVYDSDMYKGMKPPRGEGIRQATMRKRIPRRPCVGDKFASRAGQKGTMSAAWPSEDMPFTETGMTPDILFNPNGFPSRMTIGMMVEVMSGKSGALHGRFNDSTPFRFDEKNTAVDFFAEQLSKAGYEYNGNETLYSGYSGEPLEVRIFTGIVHYQRLRHMVSDKFQVRTTGSVHPLFRQPIKGRKRGGAIRFGEMERDGLLAHGAAFLLRDRLSIASDIHLLHVCSSCGSILSPIRQKASMGEITCMVCEDQDRKGCVQKVALPYSFKYLANELAAMNIRTVLELKEVV